MESEQDSDTNKQDSDDAPTTSASTVDPKPVKPPAPDTIASIAKEETTEGHIHKHINEDHAHVPRISDESLLDRIRKTDRWMILLTTVIAGTGILGWVVTCKQLNAMNESNRINREALVYVQRAFVFPKMTTHTPIYETKTRKWFWSFVVTWENSGSTPTKDLTVNIGSKAFDMTPKGDMFQDVQNRLDTPVILGPHATTQSDTIIWSAEDLAAFENGKKVLFIWGRARYRDRFEDTKVHRTRFVYKIAWLGDPQHPTPENPVFFGYPLYEKFNCADEECEQQEKDESSRQPAK